MTRAFVLTMMSLLCAGSLTGVASAGDGHDHADHGHDVSGPELGISAGYVHLAEDDDDVPGVHAHLMKRLGDEGIRRHFAAGVGAEYLFAEERHYAVMCSLAAYPWRGLVLSVSPGVQWAEHEEETEAEYSTHLEAAYVFSFDTYDLGPVIDYSWTRDEEHYMVGLHMGFHL